MSSLAKPSMKVVIAFTDATRSSPDRLLVGHLLRQLSAAGVPLGNITLLCATGLHRPMTSREAVEKLGEEIAQTVRITNHTATEKRSLAELGTIDGVPVTVNNLCLQADLLLATGVVEPHQYAGYSGGAKTVAIGCGGEPTIQATHGVAMLDSEGVRLGKIEANPFQEFVRRAGERIGLRYVANALLDHEGAIVACAAGPPTRVHDYLVRMGRAVFQVPVDFPVHAAIAGVALAKSRNLYQASRAATYLALCDATPLLPGAPIVLPAAIPEGAGEGIGEQRFYELLAAAESPQQLVEQMRCNGFPAGAQRAYILAKTLSRNPVIVVGAATPAIVRDCKMANARTMQEGLQLATELARARFPGEQLRLLDLPNAMAMLPRLSITG